MIINREGILEKLKQIKPILEEKYLLEEIALFGSYARNEQNDKSDIDIMVKLKNISYRSLCNTAYSLYDLFPNTKVQVVSKGGIKPQYFKLLENDLLYA